MNKRIKKKQYKFADIKGFEIVTDPQNSLVKAAATINIIYKKAINKNDLPVIIQALTQVDKLLISVYGQHGAMEKIAGVK